MNDLKEKAKTLEPAVRIGKNGLTLGTLEEVSKQLKKNHLIKIKLLKAFGDSHNKEETAKEIASGCNAKVVQVIGNTIVIYRK